MAKDRQASDAEKAMKILARAIYRELCAHGYDQHAIVGLVQELLNLVCQDIEKERASGKGNRP